MDAPNNVFIFAPKFDERANDATGAFQVGAQRFADYWSSQNPSLTVTTLLFNNHHKGQAIKEVEHGLATAPSQLDAVLYFGHGEKTMLASPLIGQDLLPRLLAALRAACGQQPTIMLNACLCGVSGGYASQIADGLSDLSPTVYGHYSAGHSFVNPDVNVFPHGQRAYPDGARKAWVKAISDQKGPFWMQFPFMNGEELESALGLL